MAIFDKAKTTVTLSGKEFPIRCDLYVLEQIQEKYGDISDFEYKLLGFEPERDEFGHILYTDTGNTKGMYVTPDIKVVTDALAMMVNEGLEFEEQEPLTEKKIKQLADVPLRELANILHEEYLSCFQRKNQQAMQDQSQTEELK